MCYDLDMIRKSLCSLGISILASFLMIFAPASVLAADNSLAESRTENVLLAAGETSSSVIPTNDTGECRYLLGLVSWDCGANIDNIDNDQELSNGIWIIVTNISKDLIVIAAYLILGYVIYGGYQYLFSGGEPGKVAAAKKTLTNGFIGLAIVLLANVIVSAIRGALGISFAGRCVSESCADPTTLVSNAIQWTVGICGIVAAVFVVYGGILFITSSGEAGKVQKAKLTITYALIGLAIVALAEIITAFVTNVIRDSEATGATNTTQLDNQVISKESYEKNI